MIQICILITCKTQLRAKMGSTLENICSESYRARFISLHVSEDLGDIPLTSINNTRWSHGSTSTQCSRIARARFVESRIESTAPSHAPLIKTRKHAFQHTDIASRRTPRRSVQHSLSLERLRYRQESFAKIADPLCCHRSGFTSPNRPTHRK